MDLRNLWDKEAQVFGSWELGEEGKREVRDDFQVSGQGTWWMVVPALRWEH